MASPRIEYAVLPAGAGAGQDRCFTADGVAVVLDGASAYDPEVSPDAGEYVDALGSALIQQITERPGVDLRDALADAIREVASKLALIPGKGPSSTVSVVRWDVETVDVLVLGDSPVVVQLADSTQETIVQHPQDHIAPELRRLYRERLVAGCGYDEEHRAILANLQRREASLRNTLPGYWIAEAVPEASKAALRRSWCARFVDSVFMASDGALPLLDSDRRRELRSMHSAQLKEALRELHRWEAEIDPTGKERPRSKQHDDKSVAVVVLGQTGDLG